MFDALVEGVLADRRLAREEGREEGIALGEKRRDEQAYREKLEEAGKLKQLGLPDDQIAEVFHLPLDVIAGL